MLHGTADRSRQGTRRGVGTVPDQLAVDKLLEFGMEVGETDTERGPVVSRKDREEVVDRRAVSTK